MSFSIGSLVGFVTIDHSGVRQGMTAAQNEVVSGQRRMGQQADRAGRDIGTRLGKGIHSNVKSSFDEVGKSWKALGSGLLAGAAVGGVVDFFGDAVKGASQLEQSVGGVDAVFGKYAANVHAKSQQAAQDLGLSTNAYNELITVSGAMLKNKGLADFAAQSEKLIGIGADLAAQYGGSTADAVEALNAAMRGESDPIERYGISLNETAVNLKLAQMGMEGLTGAALETAKTQARLQIIADQSKDSLGAFGRESDTLAGKQERLAAQWENQKTALGQQLLPVMVNITDFVSGTMVPAFSGMVDMTVRLAGAVGGMPGPVKEAIAVLIAFHLLKGPVGSMLDTVRLKAMYAGDALRGMSAGGAVKAGLGGVKAGLSGVMGLLGGPWGIALVGATAALGAYAQAQQDAKADTDELSKSIDKQTGQWSKSSREIVANKIKFDVNPDDLQLLKGAGVDLSKLSDEVLAGGPAFDARIEQLQKLADKSGNVGIAAKGLMLTMLRERDAAVDAYKGNKVNADLLPELAGKTDDAAGAQAGLAGATSDASGAAATAAPKVKTYGEQMDDLKSKTEDARQKQKDLATAMGDVIDAATGADSASINYEKTLDDAQERLKKRAEILKQLNELGGPSDRTKELQGKSASGVSDHTRDLQADLAKESDSKKRAKLQDQISKSQLADSRRTAKEQAGISSDLAKSQAADAKAVADERQRLLDQLDELSLGLDINTEAGRQNKQALIDLAADAKAAAEASLKNKEGVEATADTMLKRRKDFVDLAMTMGNISRPEAEKLADKYGVTKDAVRDMATAMGEVPKDVVSKLTVERDEAVKKLEEFKRILAGVRDKTVTISGIYQVTGSLAQAAAAANQRQLDQHNPNIDRRFGGSVPGYATGTLIGPGTGTSDSISAIVAETGRHMRVSAGEFISTDSSRKRNLAALEAGNRGAQLGVVRPGAAAGAMSRGDMKTLARYLGDEIRRMPNPELGVRRLDQALAGDI